jgi:hypothetical protein
MHGSACSAIVSTVKKKVVMMSSASSSRIQSLAGILDLSWILYPKNINWFVSPVAASTLGSTWKEKSSCAQNEHERNEIDCQTTSCMCVPKSKYSWNPGLLQLYTGACSAIFNAFTGEKRCLVPAFIKVLSRIWNIWLLLQRIIN